MADFNGIQFSDIFNQPEGGDTAQKIGGLAADTCATRAVPISYLGLKNFDRVLAVTWRGQPTIQRDVPISWLMGSFLIVNRTLPISWRQDLRIDRTLPYDWHIPLLVLDRIVPYSWRRSHNIDRKVPIAWSAFDPWIDQSDSASDLWTDITPASVVSGNLGIMLLGGGDFLLGEGAEAGDIWIDQDEPEADAWTDN